ncbi:hypothetical protein U1Q18_049835 [Sarracenia purpurea var. burkii]
MVVATLGEGSEKAKESFSCWLKGGGGRVAKTFFVKGKNAGAENFLRKGDQGPQALPTNMQQSMLLQRPVFKMNPSNEFWDQSRLSAESQSAQQANAIQSANGTIPSQRPMANHATATNANTNSLNNTPNNISNQSPIMVNSQNMLAPSNAAADTVNSTSSRTPDTIATSSPIYQL